MKLLDCQIKAVQATLDYVIGEYEEGKKEHNWLHELCPLCKEFKKLNCRDCPLCLLEERKVCFSFPCTKVFYWDYTANEVEPIQDLAGFLMSLKISLEMMRDG